MSGEVRPFMLPADLDRSGYRFLILVDRAYPAVSQALLDHATARFIEYWGFLQEQLTVVTLPTAQNMLCYLSRLLDQHASSYSGVLALGCLLETADPELFPILAQEVAAGLMSISCRHTFPLANEILTLRDMSQATARFSKGAEGADALVEMAVLCRSLQQSA